MEPCMVAAVDEFASLNHLGYYGLSNLLSVLSIESLFGPYWPSQRRKLCFLLGWWTNNCDMLYELDLHDSEDNWDGTQEFSIKVAQHLLQNHLEGEYQEYADHFNWGITDAPDYQLENISTEIPIRVMMAD